MSPWHDDHPFTEVFDLIFKLSKHDLIAGIIACAMVGFSTVGDAGSYNIVQDEKGKFWFEGEEGRFLSIGVNHIATHSFQAPEGSIYYDALGRNFNGKMGDWRSSVFEIMDAAEMNTIGAWSDPRLNDGTLYETPILYVAAHAKERVISGLLPDFEDIVRANTREVLSQLEDTSKIIGVFLDNEMAWYGASPWDPNPTYTILEEVFTLPASNRERQAALAWLQERYETPTALSEAWEGEKLTSWGDVTSEWLRRSRAPEAMVAREEFLALCAGEFFSRATRVVREEMPGVLILGTRFAGNAPDPVIVATGKYCDMLSFNNYRPVPVADEYLLARYWLLAGIPMMITEYSWRSSENTSGNPNSRGAGSVVPSQAIRASNYVSFLESTLSHPQVIGMHWFEWADQSPQGRFDGEDSNYGMVDIHHNPYDVLIDAMADVNNRANEIHRTSTLGLPTQLPPPPRVIVEPGQFPDRPASMDLLKEPPVEGPAVFGAPDASISLRMEGTTIVLDMETGSEWGCGVAIHGPAASAVPSRNGLATDLDGYSRIVVEGEFPAHKEFQLIVDEAGSDAPGSPSFDSGGTDDGESFAFETVSATGGHQVFEFALEDLQPRYVWGNQAGNRRVDLNSLKGVAISFPGGTGSSTVKLQSVRFEK